MKPDADALKQLVPEGTDVWLFHPPAQRMDVQQHKKTYGSNSVTLVERTGSGKNALDFQLSYYAGYLMARQPDARFVVVSNDKGYEPMLEYARKPKFQATRSEYQKPAKKAPAKPVALPKTTPAVPKPKAAPASQPVSLTPPLPVAEPTAARIAFRVKDSLLSLHAHQRSVNWADLLSLAQSLITETVADKSDLAHQACRVLQLYGTVETVMCDMDGGNLQYRGLESPLLKVVPAADWPSLAPARTVHKTIIKEQPAAQPKNKTAALKGTATRAKFTQSAAAAKPKSVAQAGAKSRQAVSHVAKKVEASLKKMSPNLPMQREGLMKVIATYLSPAIAQQMTPLQVCTVLQARQVVKISPQGVVLYFGAARAIKPKRAVVQQQTQG